ncbi:MAG: hypothetical protein AAGI52_07600 [Bacteroidota bacterium]
MPRFLALLLVLAAPATLAQTPDDLQAAYAEAEADLRTMLSLRQLTDAETEYVVSCVLYERPPSENEPCDLSRLMELLSRDEVADLDPTEREPQIPDEESNDIQPLDPASFPSPFDPNAPILRHTLAAPRVTVAYAPSGEWAVASGRPALDLRRADVVLSDGLREEVRAFVGSLSGRRTLAFGPEGVAAGLDQSGRLHVASHRSPEAVSCTAHLDALAEQAPDADPDAILALHPQTCEWVLASAAEATASGTRWASFARVVQSRLEAGERPAIAFTPDGESYVGITGTRVIRGPGIPLAFEAFVRSAQRDSFSVTNRGTLAPIGEVQAVAFDPARFSTEAGEVTGVVIVGTRGYRARGVESAVCDAVEAVLGLDPATVWREAVCSDAVASPPASAAPPEAPFAFAPERPRLAVVVHGITPGPGDDPAHNVGTVHHTTYYWGWDFLSSLLGQSGGTGYLMQPDGSTRAIGGQQWRDCSGEMPTVSSDYSAYEACQAQTPWPYHLWQMQTARGTAPAPVVLNQSRIPDSGGYLGALVTYRDGAVAYEEQVAATVEQVYARYQHVFGHLAPERQPQLYFVVHSFGGIVARTLLSLGDDDTFAALQTAAPTLYTDDLRQRAAFLRDRTVLLATMSTPHKGSPLIDFSADLTASIRQYDIVGLDDVRDAFDGVAGFIGGERAAYDNIRALARDDDAVNRTLLHPAKARRGDGSLVPIYTLGGRSPGGSFFVTPKQLFDPAQTRASIADVFLSGRHGKEAAAQFIFDRLLGRFRYGAADAAPWGHAREPLGDLLTVPHRGPSPDVLAGQASVDQEIANELVTLTGPSRYGYRWASDGVYDSDGLVGFASAHGLDLVGSGERDYFEHGQTWSVADSVADGSWYRLFRSKYGDLFPWDRDNHGSLMFNVGNGLFLHNTLLLHAGPRVGGSAWSGWDTGFSAPLPQERVVEVEVTRLKAIGETAESEINGGAEWRVYLQTGQRITVREPGNGNDWRGSALSAQRVRTSVVPIRVSVVELDGAVGDPDDPVHLSPERGREPLILYLDTRTGRVHGDAEAALGQKITAAGPAGADNRAQVELTVRVR